MRGQGWILLCGWIFLSHAYASLPKMKVRIGRNLPKVTVQGIDLQGHFFLKNETKQYPGKNIIHFNCQKLANSKKGATLVASVSSPGGLVSWGNRRYWGDLMLTTAQDRHSCDLLQNTPMEKYISTLLAKEMRGDWPIEALKAQAVAARTYAMFQKERNPTGLFALENSEKHQVSGHFFDETLATSKASSFTKGLILTNKRGELVPAFFHSKCGGHTFLPEKVWSSPVEGYESVSCPFCHEHGTKRWEKSISPSKIHRLFLAALSPGSSPSSAPRPRLILDQKARGDIRVFWKKKIRKIPRSFLRKKLGRKEIPSNNFTIHIERDRFVIKGAGLGHGVGMCQFGAFEMAKRGMNHREILAHYYPQFNIQKGY
ncbi:MAG: SpoIID/LytB domain-containing protein [Bacteriovoracales bacterium]|nr:SpoIID/LytB domain-containing protein [Bacteriovoracales bacterium]